MSYALTTIWFERYRFFPAVLAVAFSAILIAAQTGLVIGLLSMTSRSIDKSTADICSPSPRSNVSRRQPSVSRSGLG